MESSGPWRFRVGTRAWPVARLGRGKVTDQGGIPGGSAPAWNLRTRRRYTPTPRPHSSTLLPMTAQCKTSCGCPAHGGISSGESTGKRTGRTPTGHTHFPPMRRIILGYPHHEANIFLRHHDMERIWPKLSTTSRAPHRHQHYLNGCERADSLKGGVNVPSQYASHGIVCRR